ncbi:MAG: hypothetical protein Q4D29_11975 [Lachnospiraceae bacterium]|nr:hypothetical protein [Lachnospiraceae bacterium]
MDYSIALDKQLVHDFKIKQRAVRSAFGFLNNLNKNVHTQLESGNVNSLEEIIWIIDNSIKSTRYNYLVQMCRDVLFSMLQIHRMTNGSDADKLFHSCLLRIVNVKPERNLASMMAYYSIIDNLMLIVNINIDEKDGKIKKALVNRANRMLKHSWVHDIKVFIKLMIIVLSPKKQAIAALLDIAKNYVKNVICHKKAFPALEDGICLADLAYSVFQDNNVSKVGVCRINKYTIKVAGYSISGKFTLPHCLYGYLALDANKSAILIGFRGTVKIRNWVTNIQQLLLRADIVYKMALGLLLYVQQSAGNNQINVYGHSLGGGLMQFAVSGISHPSVKGFGYNSAGLSKGTVELLQNQNSNIQHLYQPNDCVFLVGRQIGRVWRTRKIIWNPWEAHCLNVLRQNCHQHTYYTLL